MLKGLQRANEGDALCHAGGEDRGQEREERAHGHQERVFKWKNEENAQSSDTRRSDAWDEESVRIAKSKG